MSEMNLTPFVSLSCCSSDLEVKWFSVHAGSIMPLVFSSIATQVLCWFLTVSCRLHSPALNRLHVCLSFLFHVVSDVSEALVSSSFDPSQSHFPAMAIFGSAVFGGGALPKLLDSSQDTLSLRP